MEVNSELKKYLKPRWTNIILGVICLIIAVFGGILGTNYNGIVDTIFTIMFIALALLMFGFGISGFVNYSKEMKRIEADGTYEQFEYDFANGVQFFSDKLRLGDYVYPKRAGKFFSYEDIAKVYQYIQKRNGIETNRELRAETKSGKIVTLSKIGLGGKADDEVKEVVAALLEKNPMIHVGYK